MDVSQDTVDVAVQPGTACQIAHDAQGIAEAVERVPALQPTVIVLEATGGLKVPLAGALAAVGLPVVVVNPRQVRDCARATGQLAKTDRLDAPVLAHFADAIRPPVRPVPDEQTQALAALVARRRQLIEMLCLLDMVALNVRNHPQVSRILAKGVTRILAGLWTLEMFLPRVFLGYPHQVEIEQVIVGLGKPDNGCISPRETAAAVQPVFKVPDDAIAHPELESGEDGVENGVQRDDRSTVDVVPHLPANTASRGQRADTLGNDLRLLMEVPVEMESLFVLLADVVRRRRDDELE
jgi:transposase